MGAAKRVPVAVGGITASLALVVIGVVVTCAAAGYVRSVERGRLRADVSARAKDRALLVQTTVQRSIEVLRSVGAFLQVRPAASRAEFAAFVAPSLADHPELLGLGWTPRVPATAASHRPVGPAAVGGVAIWPADRDPAIDCLPVCYLEPVDRNRLALGYNLASEPQRQRALSAARDDGVATATAPLHLVQDAGDSRPGGGPPGPGFIVFLPVYTSSGRPPDTVAGRRAALVGFASAVFHCADLIGPAMRGGDGGKFAATVRDVGTTGAVRPADVAGALLFATAPPGESADGPFDAVVPMDLTGRRWTLRLRPTTAFLDEQLAHHDVGVLCGGLCLTGLLAAHLYGRARRVAEVESRVAARTAELSREVADRRRAERSARVAEAQYRGIFENAVEGIFQSTPQGRYLSANRALARLYGYDSPQQLIDTLDDIADDLYVDPGRRAEFVREVGRRGEVASFESRVRRRDGTIIWISESARVVRGPVGEAGDGGEVLYYEGAVVDVTERKAAEAQVRAARDDLERRVAERTAALASANAALHAEVAERRRAEAAAAAASRAKSEFLANMSHEIRTPMNAVLGYAQLLRRDGSLRPAQAQSLDTILSSGKHLLELIDDVLDLSKIEAGRAELSLGTFDLPAVLQEVAGMFRNRCQQKALRLTVDLPAGGLPGDGVVCGDERKLRQVLINLLGNAVKFTDAGSVTLSVVTGAMGEPLRFAVADTGIGIPDVAVTAIFEPFEQAANGVGRGGTGLGLAIARRHVELMGGRLRCTSEPGVGSTFTFELPLATATEADIGIGIGIGIGTDIVIAAGGEGPVGARWRLDRRLRAVVADDVPENRQLLAEMLATLGCDVECCSGGVDAVGRAVTGRPDVVFLDVRMPDLDGVTAARQIRRRLGPGSAVRLVATTASPLPPDADESAATGTFNNVILKPLRLEQVARSLTEVTGAAAGPDVPPAPSTDGQHARPGPVPGVATGLSSPLRRRLLDAAAIHSVTDLRRVIDEWERACPAAGPTVTRLRECVHRYDLRAVAGIVEGLGDGGGEGTMPVATVPSRV